MAVIERSGGRITRRRLLKTVAATSAATLIGGIAKPLIGKPFISYASSRPPVTHGVQSGDVSSDSGMVWARTDRPARMRVDVATTESFAEVRRAAVIDVLPESDFTGKLLLEDLPAGQDIFYRIQFEDLASPALQSEPVIGRFRTAPLDRRSVSFVWSGDVVGGGFGIDASHGGLRSFATMQRNAPDFFIHCGDSIYADAPLQSELQLANGTVWRNLVTDAKAKPAETLADFHGNYRYNLLDANVRAFNADMPTFALWDDHEVLNDWCPGETVVRAGQPEQVNLLAARARRAFHDYMPMREAPAEPGRVYRKIGYGPLLDVFLLDMRSYRSADVDLLGAAQLAWLKRALTASRALWKVIAADLPLGVVSRDTAAHGDGPPVGRELEIAELLRHLKRESVRNVFWITADMHYTAANLYDPNAAVFQDFEPFWEFISGPLHAGSWSPGVLDNTFGPRAIYQKGCTAAQGDNLAPCFGLQFFGHVAIDGVTGVATVTLKDVDDNDLWSVLIPPADDGRLTFAQHA